MDSAAYATWRVGIELLNSAQRSLAFRIWRWPKRTMRWNIAMTISTKPRRKTGPNRSGRARAKPRPKLSRRPRSVRVRRRTCFRRSATVESPTLVALIVAGMKWVVGSGERQASVSLQGVPEDIRSVDGNAVGWITLQGPLDRSSASLDERRIRRKDG